MTLRAPSAASCDLADHLSAAADRLFDVSEHFAVRDFPMEARQAAVAGLELAVRGRYIEMTGKVNGMASLPSYVQRLRAARRLDRQTARRLLTILTAVDGVEPRMFEINAAVAALRQEREFDSLSPGRPRGVDEAARVYAGVAR